MCLHWTKLFPYEKTDISSKLQHFVQQYVKNKESFYTREKFISWEKIYFSKTIASLVKAAQIPPAIFHATNLQSFIKPRSNIESRNRAIIKTSNPARLGLECLTMSILIRFSRISRTLGAAHRSEDVIMSWKRIEALRAAMGRPWYTRYGNKRLTRARCGLSRLLPGDAPSQIYIVRVCSRARVTASRRLTRPRAKQAWNTWSSNIFLSHLSNHKSPQSRDLQ